MVGDGRTVEPGARGALLCGVDRRLAQEGWSRPLCAPRYDHFLFFFVLVVSCVKPPPPKVSGDKWATRPHSLPNSLPCIPWDPLIFPALPAKSRQQPIGRSFVRGLPGGLLQPAASGARGRTHPCGSVGAAAAHGRGRGESSQDVLALASGQEHPPELLAPRGHPRRWPVWYACLGEYEAEGRRQRRLKGMMMTTTTPMTNSDNDDMICGWRRTGLDPPSEAGPEQQVGALPQRGRDE